MTTKTRLRICRDLQGQVFGSVKFGTPVTKPAIVEDGDGFVVMLLNGDKVVVDSDVNVVRWYDNASKDWYDVAGDSYALMYSTTCDKVLESRLRNLDIQFKRSTGYYSYERY